MSEGGRPETIGRGAAFVAILVPLIALNAWAALAAVRAWGSGGRALIVIVVGAVCLIAAAALAESKLLLLPFRRCVREAAAAGWGFITPGLLVYGWAVPRASVSRYAWVVCAVLAVWAVLFVITFAANGRRASERPRRVKE